MNPVTHFLTGWAVAQVGDLQKRDMGMIALAGIIPDFDGFGYPFEALTKGTSSELLWYSEYHHILGHNLLFGVIFTGLCFFIAKKKWLTTSLVFLSFHLHLLGDILGARGPDGHQWPIPYLVPFSSEPQLTWSGQWYLNGWPNFAITGALLLLTFYWAWKKGFSPLGLVSEKVDQAFVRTLRERFGKPRETSSGDSQKN